MVPTMEEPTDEQILAMHGLTRDDVNIDERRVDDVLVQTTVTPDFNLAFIRLEWGEMPAATLRGEAYLDIAEDGRVLGVTVEVHKR